MPVENGIIRAPIDFETTVARALSVNNYDCGYLCTSDRINKWSLYKPISANKLTILTEDDYFAADFGYIIPSYNSYTNMRAGVTNGWTYLRPTTNFRITDFDKYDHNSTAPFALENQGGTIRIGGTARISTPTRIAWLTKWGTWSGYQGSNIQYLNCGFYIPGIGYYPLTDTNQDLDINDLEETNLSFYVDPDPGKFEVGKTYSCYLILTTWDGRLGARQWYTPSETEGGIWWVLATDNPLSFTVQEALSPLDNIYVSGEGTGDISQDIYYTWNNVALTIDVNVGSGYAHGTGTLYIEVIIDHYPGTGTTTEPKMIASYAIPGITAGLQRRIQGAGLDFNQNTSKEDSANATMNFRLAIGTANYYSSTLLTIWAN